MKRTASSRRAAPFAFELHFCKNLFSSRVTFRIPVVRGKNLDIGSFPQPVAHRGEAWRGEASEEEERACRSPLLMLIQVVEELTL